MKKINRALFLLVAYILLVFGLEFIKIYFGLNYSPPVFYIFISIIILSIIAFPIFADISHIGLITTWLIGYLICRITFYPLPFPYNSQAILNIIVENCMLGLAVTLSCQMVSMIQGFELLQERLLRPSSNCQIRFIKDTNEEISAEFYRCRRYNHKLSILAIEATPTSLENQIQVDKKSQKKLIQRFITTNLAESISQEIRRFDMILIREWNGRFFILCPENNAEGTKALALRIEDNTQKNLGLSIIYGYAIFPEDALTFDELLQWAENNISDVRAELMNKLDETSELLSENPHSPPVNNLINTTKLMTFDRPEDI